MSGLEGDSAYNKTTMIENRIVTQVYELII
jgi:hypothetical protein